MSRSSRALQHRLNRVESRHRPESDSEFRARLAKMSNGELYMSIIDMYEEVLGPRCGYASVDDFSAAFREAIRHSATDESFLPILREDWHCRTWFDAHASHGGMRIVQTWRCVQPKFLPWGQGVTATCACGDAIQVLDVFVPEDLRARVERVDD